MCSQDVFQNHTHLTSSYHASRRLNFQTGNMTCVDSSQVMRMNMSTGKICHVSLGMCLTMRIKTVDPPFADHSLGNHGFVLSILVYRGVCLYITRGKWWYCKSLDKMVVPSLDTSIWQSDVIQLPLIEEPQWWNRYFPNCWIPKALVSPFNMTNFKRFLMSKLQESTYRS